MNISEALEKATRILQEEQVQPTLYQYVFDAWPSNSFYKQFDPKIKAWPVALVALTGLNEERKKRPGDVYEDPKLWVFQSTNFDLLLKIYSQLAEADRAESISGLLDNVRNSRGGFDAKVLLLFQPIREKHPRSLFSPSSASAQDISKITRGDKTAADANSRLGHNVDGNRRNDCVEFQSVQRHRTDIHAT